jgi:hypothetical protein
MIEPEEALQIVAVYLANQNRESVQQINELLVISYFLRDKLISISWNLKVSRPRIRVSLDVFP